MIKTTQITQTGNRTGTALYRSILALAFVLFLVSQGSLFGQVISNNGAAISVTSGIVVNSKDIVNTSGSLGNNGTINLSGSYTSTATAGGNGLFTIGGNWTNTGGTFIPGLSTVIFNGSSLQTIIRTGGENFYNLSLDNSGSLSLNRVVLSDNVTVQNILLMSRGNFDAGSNKLLLSNQAVSSLNYISTTKSRIFGKFERGINQQGTYLFPLGTPSYYNPANLITNSAPAPGTVLSEFLAGFSG